MSQAKPKPSPKAKTKHAFSLVQGPAGSNGWSLVKYEIENDKISRVTVDEPDLLQITLAKVAMEVRKLYQYGEKYGQPR